MSLTRDFKELLQKQIVADPSYGEPLLRESIDAMLSGDVDTGKAILRDYIKATIGFERLGAETGTQPKSLIRMFGPRGTHRPATCSASLATCKNALASNCTWRPNPTERRWGPAMSPSI